MRVRLLGGGFAALAVLVTGLGLSLSGGAQLSPSSGETELPTTRPASPAGRLTPLQVYPTGAAVSPDGATVLAIGGPPINGGVNAGSTGGPVALMAIDAGTGVVHQVLTVSDAFQSVVFARDGSRAWVAGGTDGVVHVVDVLPGGTYRLDNDIPARGFVAGLALSPDGSRLWASEPETGAPGNPALQSIEEIDLASGSIKATIPAPTPDALAVSPDGRDLYATAWRGSSITQVDTASHATRQVKVGSQPTAVAVAPDGRVLVANSDDASLSTVTPGTWKVQRTSLAEVGRGTDAPNGVALAANGNVLVSLGADDAVAVLRPTRGQPSPWAVAGLIPTGWYPDALAVSPDGKSLNVVTARGLGRSAAGTVVTPATDPTAVVPDGAYGAVGTLESLPVPGAQDLKLMTAEVRRTLASRAPNARGSRNPVFLGRKGPIKHVIYITRENKTYDADLGDLHPGPGEALTLFGQTVTPNLHALERQFAESDNFTYEGYASNVGHLWEDTGGVSDVFERAIASDTGTHLQHLNRDWSDPTNYLHTGLLVTQAAKAGRTVRTYNMETAQQSKLLDAKYQADPSVYPNYDLHVAETVREAGWESEFKQFESHSCTGALAAAYGSACSLPALEYVYMGEDHTTVVDEPGYPSIQAQVASNDYATGKLIDAVSHSADWASTLVIVVEDDPQGTGDHTTQWHGLLGVASPWIKRGYISHVHYSLTSAVAAIDRLLGLPPITDFAKTARPLDDLFVTDGHPDLTPFAADSSGVTQYPFVNFPGVSPAADRAHGIYGFDAPDEIDPALAAASTEAQVRGRLR